MEELAAIEGFGQLLDEEAIACHVGVAGIPLTGALLYHQVQVAIAQDAPDAEFLGKPEALHKGFLLGTLLEAAKWIWST